MLGADTVALFPGADLEVDALIFEQLAAEGLARDDFDAIERALALYSGELLPFDPYEVWAFHHRQRLQLRHRELLRRGGRFDQLVALDPTDEDGHVGVMRGMLRAGDRPGVLRQFKLLTRILDEDLGVGPSVEACSLRDLALGPVHAPDAHGAPALHPLRSAPLATQSVHFCATTDGVRLAYATSGKGPPVVKASNWLTRLDYDWGSPVWQHWWQALSRRHMLVRYDERGCGLSDWDVNADSYSLEAWVRDLETVVDALGLERFPLLGISQGGPGSLTFVVLACREYVSVSPPPWHCRQSYGHLTPLGLDFLELTGCCARYRINHPPDLVTRTPRGPSTSPIDALVSSPGCPEGWQPTFGVAPPLRAIAIRTFCSVHHNCPWTSIARSAAEEALNSPPASR